MKVEITTEEVITRTYLIEVDHRLDAYDVDLNIKATTKSTEKESIVSVSEVKKRKVFVAKRLKEI